MKINRIIKTILPVLAAVVAFLPMNTLTVKADKLEVIKTYTLTVNANDTLVNTSRFFYAPDSYIEGGTGHKYIIEPLYIQFTVPEDCRASISYDISNTGNSTGLMNICVMRAQTDVKSLTDMYPGDYMLTNIAGEMSIKHITVNLKTTCYYDEYKDAISKGENWTLVNGNVVTAECTCKTKCTTQATNTECPVCKTDIAKCTAKEEATSNTSNTDAAKAEEEKKKAEEAKKAEEQKKAQAATTRSTPTTADSGVATTASAAPSAVASEELALAQGQASQIIADAQLEAQAIIETANGQAEIRLAEANEQASQILLDAGIMVGEGNKSSMPLGGMIALIILIIAVIGEGGVIAYTLLKDKLR